MAYIKKFGKCILICKGEDNVVIDKENLKYLYIILLRTIYKPLTLLPVKENRVIFESFSGDGYNCNPKYISEKLRNKYGDKVEIIWAFNNPEKFQKELPSNIKVCKYRSIKHLIYRLTSKIYVCNFLQAIEFPKNHKQIAIQTWHGGGCYKTVGNQESGRLSTYIKRQNIQLLETDFFISSSDYFKQKVIKEQFNFDGKILNVGMPRNDILIENSPDEKILNLKRKIGVSDDTIIILYAPTWKQTSDKYETLDVGLLKRSIEKRFNKKCEVLFRTHLYGNQKMSNVKNVSEYSDMQELLLISDVLITDYSSSMWDFSFTNKLCLLFTPDLEEYTSNRGFDEDIFTWGFPVCQTNETLSQEILEYSEDSFKLKMREHHEFLGATESGEASQKVTDIIISYLNI